MIHYTNALEPSSRRKTAKDGGGSFRQLVVWQQAMLLTEECYRLAARLPGTEQFGLSLQIRRAAVSIPSNIAEGQTGRSRRDYSRFVGIALGSQAELETQLELVLRLGLARAEDAETATLLVARVGRLLNGLQRYLLGQTTAPVDPGPTSGR